MKPLVSIIIVNYNGRHLMKDCLSSVLKTNYPKKRFEVIVVDNDSKDGSQTYIRRNFPETILIESPTNSGFTGGNNLGLEYAKGDYIVLLNSDTKVDRNWLKPLVDTALNNKKVGLINSKLLFHIPFTEISIESKQVPHSSLDDSIDHSPVGILVEKIVPLDRNLTDLAWYAEGFYEKQSGIKKLRWTKGIGKVLLPITNTSSEKFKITVHGYPASNKLSTPIVIKNGNNTLVSDNLKSLEVKQYTIEIKTPKQDLIWLVQNAGNVVFHNGYSRDRGSVVKLETKENQEFYEMDSKYFNRQAKLAAVCGASCLIKREVIDEIGFLDGNYFMYYEDIDFSLRAWRMGWDILYEPKSIVYHKHRATTGKTISSFFINMTERNHISLLITHFPTTTVIIELIGLLMRLTKAMASEFKSYLRPDLERRRKTSTVASGRRSAVIDIIKYSSQSLKNRVFWKRREKRSYKQLRKILY